MTFLPTYILAHVIISQLTDSSAVTNHALQFSAKHVLQTVIKNRTWCGPSSAAQQQRGRRAMYNVARESVNYMESQIAQ